MNKTKLKQRSSHRLEVGVFYRRMWLTDKLGEIMIKDPKFGEKPEPNKEEEAEDEPEARKTQVLPW